MKRIAYDYFVFYDEHQISLRVLNVYAFEAQNLDKISETHYQYIHVKS